MGSIASASFDNLLFLRSVSPSDRRSFMSRLLCCLSFALLTLFTPAAMAVPLYTLTVLPPPPGSANSAALFGINDNGIIVGRSGAGGNALPVTWDASGAATPLALPSGTVYGRGFDVNASGVVVGVAGDGDLDDPFDTRVRAVRWTSAASPEFLSGLEDAPYSEALGINAAGTVVGTFVSPSDDQRGFYWRNGTLEDVGAPTGSVAALLRAVNGAEQAAGLTVDDVSFQPHAVRYVPGIGWVPLAELGGSYSIASDINEAGQIAGEAEDPDELTRAILWDADGMPMILDLLSASDIYSAAIGLNDSGAVVGISVGGDGTSAVATLWSGGVYDLNALVAGGTGTLSLVQANAINALGWIVGLAVDTESGLEFGFLLTPVTEPAAAAFLALGLVALAVRRKATQTTLVVS